MSLPTQDHQIGSVESIDPPGLVVSVWRNTDGTIQVNVYRDDEYESAPVALFVDGDEAFFTNAAKR